MLEGLKRLLMTLRVFDDNGTLSWTALVLACTLAKFMVSDCNTEYLVALLGAAAAYQGKKVINAKAANDKHAKNLQQAAKLIEDMSSRISSVETRTQVLENRTQPGVRR